MFKTFIDILVAIWAVFKHHLKEWGGFYLASAIWAGVFQSLSRNSDILYWGDTDYWGWLFFTYFALITGFSFGMNKNKK
ncbi:MAG: hypothetical protein A3J93_00415 [Candidatus Magasanikbacteria bacterium RIFOXYC2_FULL_42_28]|uniref:Uncharacterized protein n=1 Tax=Candidatus Magasanikbacteria bacterium RIFOXYC2_FULL_42_28 TaxID=1798704 RepID=A0A1F6NWD2_9BACT|nr:MAG: hypothetical protein A3J93_00415 [Candidatus Magasanikbacteria bacterium RIFOXYC2_FULL_42_28]